ncbi:hypothetical protein IKX73_01885, partial [Candidatus Saccharibacteria bacterium]|nr:hypothetical protein [Candidatus Saccharibacteria bacterium]
VINATTNHDGTAATGYTGTSSTNFTIGAKASADQAAGDYTNVITFTAVTNAPPRIYMQNITQSMLATLMPNVGDSTTLYDNRDEKPYVIAKLADNNYWMVQNLDHDIRAVSDFYTNQNTDIGYNSSTNSYETASWVPMRQTYPTSPTNTSQWCQSGTWRATNGTCRYNYTPESYDPGNVYWNGVEDNTMDWEDYIETCDFSASATIICDETENPIGDYIANGGTTIQQYHLGNYYNWTAAVAMNDSSSVGNGVVVDRSICPAGWTLPHYISGSGSFSSLWSFQGFGSSNPINGNNKLWTEPINYVLGSNWNGYYYEVGKNGSYLSSWTAPDNGRVGVAIFSNDFASANADESNGYGYFVRCLARPFATLPPTGPENQN